MQFQQSCWNIIKDIFFIIGTIAAIIAAYYSFKSRPKKVKNVSLEIENVELLDEEQNEWKLKFSFNNWDNKTVIRDSMVSIEATDLNLIKVNPMKGSGGLTTVPKVILEDNSINLSNDKIKPRTRQVFSINAKAEPGEYNLDWYAYGPNLKEKKDSIKLHLEKDLK